MNQNANHKSNHKLPDIVTRNFRHLKPAQDFGIHVLSPAQFITQLNAPP